MRINILGYVMIFFILLICLKIYYESDAFNLKCIYSTKDGNKYCVRERHKITKAANLLSGVTIKMKKLVAYMKEHFINRPNVKRLVENFNPKRVNETLPTSEFTAYSENKGEKLAFCLNKSKIDNENLIDENTLTFVAIHELGHIMSETVGHNEEFWNNFKFLLEQAVKIGIYNPIDYKKNPKSYCGMDITDNPYYDMN
jgi:hypothetical protein